MKKCTICNLEKELNNFSYKNRANNIRQSHCKSCQSKKASKYYLDNKDKFKKRARKNNIIYNKRNKQYIQSLKSKSKCKYCSESEPVCLDFHHLDSSEKEETIAKLSNWSVSLQKLKKEISKCIIVCSNCHRKIHAGLIK